MINNAEEKKILKVKTASKIIWTKGSTEQLTINKKLFNSNWLSANSS